MDKICCGWTHVVVYNKKECYGWGQHEFGALGFEASQVINNWMPRRIPMFISSHENLIEVSCGNNTTIFNISQKFYCFGDNRHGELGQLLYKPVF